MDQHRRIKRPINKAIPNELKITINTRVPGFQTINYLPSMTIPNISKDDKTIHFEPLIKLKQSSVNSVPDNLRKKQFFNSGLFKSLLRLNGAPPVSSLEEANYYGNIDNNIQVTLNTLFPTNGVIYIGNKPYAIIDKQWTNGDWKVDTKQKPVKLDSNKITNTYLRSAVVKEDIISGENELKQLPENLVYGPNYDGPRNPPVNIQPSAPPPPENLPVASPVASGIQNPPETLSMQQPENQQEQYNEMQPYNQQPYNQQPYNQQPYNQQPYNQQPYNQQPYNQQPYNQQEQYNEMQPYNQQPYNQQPYNQQPYNQQYRPRQLMLPPPEQEMQPGTEFENGMEPEMQSGTDFENGMQPEMQPEMPLTDQFRKPMQEILLNPSRQPTAFLRSFFSNNNFYFLINEIFKNMSPQEKDFLYNIFLKTTNVEVKKENMNISRTAYNQTVEALSIYSNTGEGDCFFISVADAINYYNSTNENKIMNGIYGNTQIFTPLHLRGIVLEHILTSPNKETYIQNSLVNADEMNRIFKEQIEKIETDKDIPIDQYLNIANDVYKSLDNFLVQNIHEIPKMEEDYFKPFKAISVDNPRELSEYINSPDYWANSVAIDAISNKLKLKIIPIEKKDDLLSIWDINTSSINTKWNHYMFLYHDAGHFELVGFNYKKGVYRSNARDMNLRFISKRTVIFNRNDPDIVPPIYIFFILFGSYYLTLSPENKANFDFFPQFMKSIYNSFIKIKEENNPETEKVLEIFNIYFPNTSNMIGGYNPRYNPRYNRNPINNMTGESDSSHIAYYIKIDMELYPGTSLPEDQLKDITCRQRWNTIQKSYSDFTGKKNKMMPDYELLKRPEQKTRNKFKGGKNAKTKKMRRDKR